MSDGRFRFCIDRGGTFTDVYAEIPAPPGWAVLKLLSDDPANYADAPTEGIRRVLEAVTGVAHPRGEPIDASRIEWIRMGTTVATNALLEREGARVVLVTTAGFADLLEIGTQARPQIFDLSAARPSNLYESVVEVRERVRVLRASEQPARAASDVALGTTGERVEVLTPLDVEGARAALEAAAATGARSAAVALLHAHAYPAHEREVGRLARAAGFTHVSLSSAIAPMIRAVPRGQTACVDAYLTPRLAQYLESFARGFVPGTLDLGAHAAPGAARVLFMQSDGGLARAQAFSGCRAILSGPAGGVVGFSATTARACGDGAVLGFDMGGTSTDVSRYAGGGRFELVFETETAGARVQAPQLDINTVAAGGGSRLFFRDGALLVGPESAKAVPGPVCYRREGGLLALTDANLALGRLLPHHFPAVFGPAEDQPLDADGARAALGRLAASVDEWRAAQEARGAAGGGGAGGEGARTKRARTARTARPATSVEQLAAGFVRVANEVMARPVRELSEARGFAPAQHVLACFGGAAPQHACALARSLGIRRAFVHRYCGILSAYGLGLADTIVERTEPAALELSAPGAADEIAARHARLRADALAELSAQGFAPEGVRVERYLNLRYDGTDHALMVLQPQPDPATDDAPPPLAAYAAALADAFRREYGFDAAPERAVRVDDVRVRALGRTGLLRDCPIEQAPPAEVGCPPAGAVETTRVYFDAESAAAAGGEAGWAAAPVYTHARLRAGHKLPGPALVVVGTSTCVLEPGCVATVTAEGDLLLDVPPPASLAPPSARPSAAAAAAAPAAAASAAPDGAADPVLLSVLSNRFMSIAEQMGRTLQRTATSVNIKERLDFSCALFAADGSLVANAPHVPVHLGAMADTVAHAARQWEGRLGRGDVLVTNDPAEGGSHLPDVTVITPVLDDDDDDDGGGGSSGGGSARVAYWVASRGHHADVGGLTPGSMPHDSQELVEEGALLSAFKLVEGHAFAEGRLLRALRAPAHVPRPPGAPPLAGCRNERDVVADLRAQVAANQRGVSLLRALEAEVSRPTLCAYMAHVQAHAEAAVRALVRQRALSLGAPAGGATTVRASDWMDDGTAVELALTLDAATGDATCDWRGCGAQVLGNWNAPRAISSAATMYVLRCLVGREIPLNSGCLRPVAILHRQGSVLAPARGLAVCAGNVLTSQRVTDVLLRALGAAAASQGCMNNLTFGDGTFGYYETIAGGAGAGPSWHGASGVQCHMTNTRITDVEVLEARYPVRVVAFTLRRGSGGDGRYRGGDGVVRELELLRDGLSLTVLSERRVLRPFGLHGGEPGLAGRNTLTRAHGGECVSLGGKNRVRCARGDVVRIETPGGGGWGAPPPAQQQQQPAPHGAQPGGGAAASVRAPAGGREGAALGGTSTASLALGSNAVEF